MKKKKWKKKKFKKEILKKKLKKKKILKKIRSSIPSKLSILGWKFKLKCMTFKLVFLTLARFAHCKEFQVIVKWHESARNCIEKNLRLLLLFLPVAICNFSGFLHVQNSCVIEWNKTILQAYIFFISCASIWYCTVDYLCLLNGSLATLL